jgi:MFS family permease
MERWGRKIALIIATVVFVVGSILQTAVVDQISMIYAGRVLVGLGVGTITAASPVFLAEISPPAIRGTLVGFYEIMYQVGALVGEFPSPWSLAAPAVTDVGFYTRLLDCLWHKFPPGCHQV